MAGYTEGRIKRIKICNFMGYDEVDIIPGNGLNLITGLNASGKSSLMCAICLGLAGKPQFTGRASSLSQFVKDGKQQAEIEIELESTQDRNVVITQKIIGNTCEWYLNKNPSNFAEVTGTVKTFNIDTSNLCQFLPQDKVTEFSKMDKRQRLENMLQSIGEPKLFEIFNELKFLYEKCGELETKLKKLEDEKKSAEENNFLISDEVRKQEYRIRLKKELEEMIKTRSVFIYKHSVEEINLLKKEQQSLKDELVLLVQERNEALARENAILFEYQEQAEKLCRSKSKVHDLARELNEKSSMVLNLNGQVDNANIEFENRIAEKESQKKRFIDITTQIADLERLLREEQEKNQNMKEQEISNNLALSQLQIVMSELYQNMENASTEKSAVSYETQKCKNQLMALKDEQNTKLLNLKNYDEYTYEALLWLNENSGKFKSRIYLPILKINVHSKEYLKYIEYHISEKDMFAFVCEDKEDCRLLIDILKNQKKLPVNIVMAPDKPLSYFKSPELSQEFKNWGLEYFLIDLFTAPESVMRYLCACYFIHNIPVVTSAIDNSKVDAILQTFRVFYTDNIKITAKKSHYGEQNWSVRSDFITNLNLLVNYDDSALQELEQRIQILEEQLHIKNIAYEKLKAEYAEKEKIQEKLRQEKKYFIDSQKQIQTITTKLSMKKNKQKQMAVVISEEAEKAKVSEKIQSVNPEKEKLFIDINNIFKDMYSWQKEIIKHILSMNILSSEYKMDKAGNAEIHDKVKAKEKKIAELGTVIDEKMIPARKLYKKIKVLNFQYELYYLQTNLEETEAKISHLQAQLNLSEDNEALIDAFNDRQQRIASFVTDINEIQSTLNNLRRCIDEKKQEWLNPMQHHITNINKKFSRYFKRLGCAGEITLDVPNDSNDFANYGLKINLKFHDDQPMTEFSQNHHSGGECSVTAIVFILSLQELTQVPFRCIDEINQGMDSIYERKIYHLIADSVKNDSCSQYFLFTPKLLVDLKYPDGIVVHIIYKSCYFDVKLDIKELLKIARST